MARKKGFRRVKKNRWRAKLTTEANANQTNALDPAKNTPTEDKGKDSPTPTSLSKEPNLPINLDSGSNTCLDRNTINNEEYGNRNDETPTIVATPMNFSSTVPV